MHGIFMIRKAVKKAKKGILSVVFGRTALILALLLLQIGVMISMVTVLKDYRTYMDVVLMDPSCDRGDLCYQREGKSGIYHDLDFADDGLSGVWNAVLYLCKIRTGKPCTGETRLSR